MDVILVLKAIVMGIVEGLTEFLPISSTGHLILVGSLLNFDDARAKLFDVVIQFGAILAVCWEFRRKIGATVSGLTRADDVHARRFALNVVIACLPAVVFGLLLGGIIKEHLFSPVPVALAAIVGGLVILWVERRERSRGRVALAAGGDARTPAPEGHAHEAAHHAMARVHSLEALRWTDALKVGFAQCLALIPGTSRSGATIIGGMLFGLERKVATEFSFFLAIPIIFGASAHDLYKARHTLQADDLGLLLIGLIAALISALICVRWLLRFIANHDFTVFAYYRIVFGLVILIAAYGFGEWQTA
ncbi:undecaprenyl-diphosphate phosphatase [Robbsia sp. KACC 23696]|uniref:undecaprenyl-diphosphate phosphatase n=1 Tax=Robbsia sp. KACC 23696 TaxID=3149231 RepID=UPI00325BA3E9